MANPKTPEEQDQEEFDAAFEEATTPRDPSDELLGAPEDDTSKSSRPAAEAAGDYDVEPEEVDWEALPPAARAAYEAAQRQAAQWEQRARSDAGRVSSLQQKIANAAKVEGISVDEIRRAMESVEGWESFAKEYPSAAQPIERQMVKLGETISQKILERVERRVAPVESLADAVNEEVEEEALAEAHPDWREVAASEKFLQWVAGQPKAVKDLVQSSSAADAAACLDYYKAATGRGAQRERETDPNRNENQQDLREERKRRMENAQGVPRRGNSPRPQATDDYAGAFDYFARQIELEQQRQH